MTTPVLDPQDPAMAGGDQQFTQGGMGSGNATNPTGASASVEAAGEIKKPIYEGLGVKLNTQEELVEYTKNIEAKMVEATLAANRNVNQNNNMNSFQPAPEIPKAQASDPNDIDNLIFTNPKKALEIYGNKIKNDIDQSHAAKTREQKFWDDFYVENPDLRNAERIVKSVTGERWHEISKMPLAEAKRVLVKESREIVSKLKGDTGTKTELQRTTAQALPSSGGSVPARVVAQDEPPNFIAEVKRMQAKRKA